MKKIFLGTAVFMWVFTFSVFGLAQTTASAAEQFTEFKSNKFKLLGRDDAPKIVLSVLTQKQSNGSGKLDFIIYGKMAGYKLEIQPVKMKDSLVEMSGEKITTQSKAADGIAQNIFAEPTIITPLFETANAVEITWSLKDSYKEGSSKILVPIGIEPKLTTAKFTFPQDASFALK